MREGSQENLSAIRKLPTPKKKDTKPPRVINCDPNDRPPRPRLSEACRLSLRPVLSVQHRSVTSLSIPSEDPVRSLFPAVSKELEVGWTLHCK
jgi:hypothetical protein